MPQLRVGPDVDLYYEDVGAGPPVVLVPGWPLTLDSWECQVGAFAEAGHRVVGYDRRGFGRSTRAWTGYDAATLVADLAGLIEHLDLRSAVLVGFSSGAVEATGYLATRGTDRVRGLVLGGPLAGAVELGRDLQAAGRWHRVAMLDDVLTRFFSVNGEIVLDEATRSHLLHSAAGSSARGTLAAIDAWADPTVDLAVPDVPALVVVGDSDAVAPTRQISAPTVTIPSGPHAAHVTHPQQWNEAVLAFLAS
ncbi:alpha/beta fold hydrolase [Actinokineospora diospyrosa]|uniref:alpha/beta fold hydrolase n=1 Tax=Actinokineospora diospyrosa TaxID=103728 RepID=UPI0020A3BF11|nr:alpha/beta hydrolase [Actinokineospora diospyrosa]